jgi:hypothetical protein
MPSRPDNAVHEFDSTTCVAGDGLPAPAEPEAGLSTGGGGLSAARVSPAFRRVMIGLTLITTAYVLYERVSTSANADRITHLQSYGDEMVAIGMTENQPGFVLLARLPSSQVSVEADMRSNWLTGQQTLVSVHTPAGTTSIRLRDPQAIMVHEDGTVIKTRVPWTLDEFGRLLHAADCASGGREHQHRCGHPFEDVAHALASWPEQRVPASLREFVKKRSY